MGPKLSADAAGALYAAAVGVARDPGFVSSNVHGWQAQYQLLKQVVRYCKRRRTAVDVGAHVGLWTIGLLQFFARVEAFEPTYENYQVLDQNVPQENVALHMVALGDRDCRVQMELPPGGNSGMWQAKREALGATTMAQLDAFHLRDVDFIKMDAEGLEGEVIVGARRTIKEHHPLIFFEDNGLRGKEGLDPRKPLAELDYVRLVRLQKNELWAPALSL